MKIKFSMASGFVGWAIWVMVWMLYALLTGQLESESFKITWYIFIALTILLAIGMGFIGVIIGFVFSKIYHRIPVKNIIVISILYHVMVVILLSLLNGISYFASIDFVFNLAVAVFIGWFFIWFYGVLSKETIGKVP